ncbi:MAG TPA: DUF1491 family protein [Sphingomicrobium sp.]
MSGGRLPPRLEVPAIIRRAETQGGFATVLRKGDPEGGALILLVSSRGRHFACLERILGMSGAYEWHRLGPGDSASPAEVAAFLAKRRQFDPDLWLVELDIAAPERFIAETTSSG